MNVQAAPKKAKPQNPATSPTPTARPGASSPSPAKAPRGFDAIASVQYVMKSALDTSTIRDDPVMGSSPSGTPLGRRCRLSPAISLMPPARSPSASSTGPWKRSARSSVSWPVRRPPLPRAPLRRCGSSSAPTGATWMQR